MWMCGMPTMQYSARRARLSVHKMFTTCIRRGLVSRDSIVDGEWLPATASFCDSSNLIHCQRYLPCCQPGSDVALNSGKFHVRSVQARGMTLN